MRSGTMPTSNSTRWSSPRSFLRLPTSISGTGSTSPCRRPPASGRADVYRCESSFLLTTREEKILAGKKLGHDSRIFLRRLIEHPVTGISDYRRPGIGDVGSQRAVVLGKVTLGVA